MELEKEIVLKNKYGLHARPATLFAEVANKYEADVTIVKSGQEVNGKSIFGIMMLGAEKGTVLKIRAVGEDADKLMKALEDLIESRFREDE
jgi:phosphocarrier protein